MTRAPEDHTMENSSFEVSSLDDPQLILGRAVEVFWPEEEDWYSGVVAEKVRLRPAPAACNTVVGQAATTAMLAHAPWHGGPRQPNTHRRCHPATDRVRRSTPRSMRRARREWAG